MTLLEIQKNFNTEKRCIDYLTKLRWNGKVTCPFCDSQKITKRNQSNPLTEYHCNHCNKDFTVLYDTIFERSNLSLPKWLMLVGLMLNSKMGISAKEIERNIGLTYKTAWYCLMRIRCAMIDHQNIELENIIEMDEAYMGGKPRKRYKNENSSLPIISSNTITNKRGRGTKKTPVVGIVERGNIVVLKVIHKLTSHNLISMLKDFVKLDKSIVVTDEFSSYKSFDEIVQHFTVDHSKKEYVRGMMHTNTIEGFWSLVRNSIKGSYRAISKKYLPFYLVQSQYMYNYRNYKGNLFEKFLIQALTTDRDNYMNKYQPIKNTENLVYK